MLAAKELLQRKKVNFSSLAAYGFKQTTNGFLYETSLLNGQFTMQVFIDGAGQVWTELLDNAANSEYFLHTVENAQGEFVGTVRAAYQEELNKIAAKCFQPDIFQSPVTKQLIDYVAQAYHDSPEFLWAKFPDYAVFRRPDNQKWYAVLLTIAKNKIGLPGLDKIEIIDLRLPPEELAATLDGAKYFPGYHMNKKHWYTICLDGSVELAEICRRLEVSYQLAKKK